MDHYPAPKAEPNPEGETIEQADGSSVTQLPGGSIIIRERAGSRADHLGVAEAAATPPNQVGQARLNLD